MPRRVQTPDGIVEFPDDATDAEIDEALNAGAATTPSPPRTWTDMAVDALPMIGGAAGGVLGAISGIPSLGLGSLPAATVGAGVLGAGGEAARQMINRLRGKPAPASMGEAATDIAVQGAGQGALELGGQLAPRALMAGGKAVYRGYLKPSLSKINVKKAAEIVDTAFREGLPITEGATTVARTRIAELKARVDTELARTPGEVNLTDVANKVRTWARTMYGRAGRAPEDLEAALKVADRIDSHPSQLNPFNPQAPVTASATTANQIKRDLQEGVGPTQYGIQSRAAKTAEKMGARETRVAVEGLAPDVAPLNMRESKLIDLARSLMQATGREANQSKLHGVKTIGSVMFGGEEYRRTGDPYSAAGKALALRMFLSPIAATNAALLAGKMGQKVPGTAAADVARAAVQAVLETGQFSQDEQGSRK